MATQPDDDHNDDDDTLNLTDKLDDQAAQQGDDDNQSGDDDQQQGDDDQPTVAFEGDDPPPEENSVIRQIRNELRETKRKLAEAEKASAPKPVEIGEKPTLTGCEYDEERYEAELDAWKDRKAAAERQTESHAEQSRKADEEWQQDVSAFEQEKGALDFEDRDEAIATATAALSLVQQAVIVKAAAKPALFMIALGKSPAKLAEVLKFEDPIKLAAAVALMEGTVKVTRKAPNPDKPLRGSAAMPVAGAADKELEKLEKEADRTNDRTKVIAYKSELKAKAAEAKK